MLNDTPRSMLTTQAPKTPFEAPMVTYAWEDMEPDVLVKYRDEINAALYRKVGMKLDEVNLEEELLLQLHISRVMQTDFKDDEEIPLNQRVQLVNSVSSVIEGLIKLQAKVYDSERFKSVENAMIRALDTLPEEAAAKFLADYEKIVNSAQK